MFVRSFDIKWNWERYENVKTETNIEIKTKRVKWDEREKRWMKEENWNREQLLWRSKKKTETNHLPLRKSLSFSLCCVCCWWCLCFQHFPFNLLSSRSEVFHLCYYFCAEVEAHFQIKNSFCTFDSNSCCIKRWENYTFQLFFARFFIFSRILSIKGSFNQDLLNCLPGTTRTHIL